MSRYGTVIHRKKQDVELPNVDDRYIVKNDIALTGLINTVSTSHGSAITTLNGQVSTINTTLSNTASLNAQRDTSIATNSSAISSLTRDVGDIGVITRQKPMVGGGGTTPYVKGEQSGLYASLSGIDDQYDYPPLDGARCALIDNYLYQFDSANQPRWYESGVWSPSDPSAFWLGVRFVDEQILTSLRIYPWLDLTNTTWRYLCTIARFKLYGSNTAFWNTAQDSFSLPTGAQLLTPTGTYAGTGSNADYFVIPTVTVNGEVRSAWPNPDRVPPANTTIKASDRVDQGLLFTTSNSTAYEYYAIYVGDADDGSDWHVPGVGTITLPTGETVRRFGFSEIVWNETSPIVPALQEQYDLYEHPWTAQPLAFVAGAGAVQSGNYTVATNSEHSSGWAIDHLYDNNIFDASAGAGSGWASASTPSTGNTIHIWYDFTTPQTVTHYRIWPRFHSTGQSQNLRTWELRGAIDSDAYAAGNFISLDYQSLSGNASTEAWPGIQKILDHETAGGGDLTASENLGMANTYVIPYPQAFQRYWLAITDNFGGSYAAMNEFALCTGNDPTLGVKLAPLHSHRHNGGQQSFGIGTTKPEGSLHIKSNNPYNTMVQIENDQLAVLQFKQPGAARKYAIELGRSDGDMTFNNGSAEVARFRYHGRMGINNASPRGMLHITAPDYHVSGHLGYCSASGSTGSRAPLILESHGTRWALAPHTSNHALGFHCDTSDNSFDECGYLKGDTSVGQITFTGSHIVLMNQHYNEEDSGLIVSAQGNYINLDATIRPSISESLPFCDLTSTVNDPTVFGVVSGLDEDGTAREFATGNFTSSYRKTFKNECRVRVNSLGEGGIWVVNINGPLVNGDFISSSTVKGYGMKQSQHEGLLANFTVAKITCDCDFQLDEIVRQRLKRIEPTEEALEANHKTRPDMTFDSAGDPEFEDALDDDGDQVMVQPYDTRFVAPDGTILTEAEYHTTVPAYIACFVGCTYHCG